MKELAEVIDTESIKKIRAAAESVHDMEAVGWCDDALGGDMEAMAKLIMWASPVLHRKDSP